MEIRVSAEPIERYLSQAAGRRPAAGGDREGSGAALPCGVVVGVCEKGGLVGAAAEADQLLGGLIAQLISSGEIRGKRDEITILHTQACPEGLPAPLRSAASQTCDPLRLPSAQDASGARPPEAGKLPCRVVVVGMGKAEETDCLAVRRAMAAAARSLRDRGCRRLGTTLHQMVPAGVRAAVEGAYLGLYRGEECKTEQSLPSELEELCLLGIGPEHLDSAEIAARAGRVAGEATNYARRLANLPANELTPSRLAEEARATAESVGLGCQVMGPDELREMGMGALLAVAQGSDQPARLIVLRHEPEGGRGQARAPAPPGGRAPLVALVGKGLTFDSGGISLKPADQMHIMKRDMAGAAAVLAAMRAIAELKLDLNVIGLVPATENLPSGHAYRPGDVVKAFNGSTIEIISTDAEGRLLLADALAYAKQLGATHLVDVATLTGACVVALGHVASGVMGNDNHLVEAVLDAADQAGERMWRLPLFPEYRRQLDSPIADIKNVGGRPAGAITGGWFLREFVGDTSWVHIDIAGTAWSEKDEPHQVEGATGAGTRTLIRLIERMAGGMG